MPPRKKINSFFKYIEKATKRKNDNDNDIETVKEMSPPKKSKSSANGKVKVTKRKNDNDIGTVKEMSPHKKTKSSENGKMNKFSNDFEQINFEIKDVYNLKIASWNVAGLRALTTKGGMDYVKYEKPDIFCMQEIKCLAEEVPEAAKIHGYHAYYDSKPGGHGGVAMFSKKMPYNVEYGINDEEFDKEGRIITAEYVKFYLICVYVPNAGRKLVNLEKRLRWNKLFEKHLKVLNKKKPVIVCGDMNVAHNEIDIANPKSNKRSAGFTQEERDGMTDMLANGFIDTFRELYPNKDKAYTYWTYLANARKKNVGWRLDYFIASSKIFPNVVDNIIRTEVFGSDHCPLVLLLNI